MRDIVGLYLNPPDRTLARCVDEKSQIQALDRTQPPLPMRRGNPSGTAMTTGATARSRCSPPWTPPLDIATGRVIGRCYQRHRTVEFRKLLAQVEQAVPADLDIHLVLVNYATTPPVKA